MGRKMGRHTGLSKTPGVHTGGRCAYFSADVIERNCCSALTPCHLREFELIMAMLQVQNGYVRIARQPADCGIATEPLYVEYDVDR